MSEEVPRRPFPGMYTTLYTKVLMFTSANSRDGRRPVFREDYLRNLRKVMGANVEWMNVLETLKELEQDGEVWIEHVGSDDFKVWLTEKSLQRFRRQEGRARTSPLPSESPSGSPDTTGASLPNAKVSPPKNDEDDLPTSLVRTIVTNSAETPKSSEQLDVPESTPIPPRPDLAATQDIDRTLLQQRLQELESGLEAIARREKVLNDRLVRLVERERELIRRESEFEETRKHMERGLTDRRGEAESMVAELRARLVKLEEIERESGNASVSLPARIASLEQREEALLVAAKELQDALQEQEAGSQDTETQQKRLRRGVENAHRALAEHVERHRKSRKD